MQQLAHNLVDHSVDFEGDATEATHSHVATYIASMLSSLKQMSKANNMEVLSYLLEMAREQAEEEAKA